MKKALLSALSIVCLTGMAIAQDYNKPPVPPVPPEQIEYNNMVEWLFNYYNQDKEATYQMLNGIQEKIRAEFPMDQKLVDAVNAARAQSDAALLVVAKKYGFTNYDEFYMDLKYHPEKYNNGAPWQEIELIWKQGTATEQNLTKEYNEALSKRVQTAEIEAIKRLQENAKAMK